MITGRLPSSGYPGRFRVFRGYRSIRGITLRRRNRVLTPVLIVLFFLTVPCIAGADLRIGDTVPSITLSGVNGTAARIPESFRGKVVILHFWRIGCSSCRLEMPAMDVLYKQYRKKGLEILAVNVGQKKEVVRSFTTGLSVSYPLLIDPDEKGARLLGVTDVPRTYIIDRKGTVRYRILGGATPEILKKLILSLL
jgi:cytochrome c biogenesis protein CcmG, thiol:disulfide interchange protein DsbE